MKEAALACRTVLPTPAAAAKPELAVRAALQRAWEQTTALGSSTAFIAFVQPNERRLVLANMGDSGVIVLRPAAASSSSSASDANSYSVAFRTVEQQHYFNCPYQVKRIARILTFAPLPLVFACVFSA